MNMTARVSEEEQHLLVEMENSVKSLHTSCVKRREIMCKLQITDDSDVNTIEGRKGIYSLQSKALHEDQVNLCVACNLFKDFIVLPSEIVNYMEQHIDVKHNYIIEIESDDDDAEIDDESELLGWSFLRNLKLYNVNCNYQNKVKVVYVNAFICRFCLLEIVDLDIPGERNCDVTYWNMR